MGGEHYFWKDSGVVWYGLILQGNDIIYAKLQQENTVHLDWWYQIEVFLKAIILLNNWPNMWLKFGLIFVKVSGIFI